MPKKPPAAGHTHHLVVSKPISLLNRDVKADIGGLFKALGKSVVHFGTGKTWELVGDVAEAAAALGLKTDPGRLAWYLIQRSLLRAMYTLTDEAWLRRVSKQPDPSDELEEKLDGELGKTTLEVTKDFFRHPDRLPFLDACTGWFRLWLLGVGFDKPKAASISQRLRTYFVYALNQEWRAHPELYAPIVSAADTPFTSAGERERGWEKYAAWLGQELDGPLFGEPFSLRQLYIPLRGFYEHSVKGLVEAPLTRDSSADRKRIAVDFTSHLLEWVKNGERDDAFRVVSGGPGSGKSSVARMFTAEVLANTSWRGLYVPLHRIQYKGDIIPAIEDYLQRTDLLPGQTDLFDRNGRDAQLLIIFDGLDELAMLGKVAQETASQFVRAVKDFVRDQNTTALRIKVILTGRTVIMQSLESEFRKEGSVIHLVPYFVEKAEKDEYLQGWPLLEGNDQRQEWWRTYGDLTGRNYAGLPQHFDRPDLTEVSSEPLLNYLLALADQTKTLDFNKEVTQNEIYASLVHELYDRRWADGENFAVKGMTEDHFHRVLEEIAVAAWHGDGRKTTVGEIKGHCQDAGIMKMLETFQEGAESGVLRLLTAFFFRQAGVRDDENAFEFTHKSFGEYLVARRVIRMVGIMEKKAEEQKREFTGWDERKCLEEWARLCGPSALTERQWEFLQNEMRSPVAAPARWQLLLVSLINTLLRHDMPMEKLGLLDFRTMRSQSRNADEALLATLNACARVTETVSNVLWPEGTSAGVWLKHLLGQRSAGKTALSRSILSWLAFNGQVLHAADFFGANLNHCSLVDSEPALACLVQADLQFADLESAVLFMSNLEVANLQGAHLKEAMLLEASLKRANLRGADLRQALLEGANLEEADLERTNLQGANLQRANLHRANLKEANLQGANFRGANLDEAILDDAASVPSRLVQNGGQAQ